MASQFSATPRSRDPGFARELAKNPTGSGPCCSRFCFFQKLPSVHGIHSTDLRDWFSNLDFPIVELTQFHLTKSSQIAAAIGFALEKRLTS
jgi:hypothetical protein